MAYNDNTPLSFLTVGDLRELMAKLLRGPEPRYVKGLSGLMEIFGCSHSQAMRIKASGVIDAAIRQNIKGGNFLVDSDKAIALYDMSRKTTPEPPSDATEQER